MTPSELVRMIARFCEAERLEYFVTGSVASSVYGVFRNTHDVDVVVALSAWKVGKLLEAFPESDFYVSDEAAKSAIAQSGQFNIIHHGSGLKIDVIIPDESPCTESRFDRVVSVDIGAGITAKLASPEDVILSKLQFSKLGRSQKHLNDIGNILVVRRGLLDLPYLDSWARRLGVAEEWRAVQERVPPAP